MLILSRKVNEKLIINGNIEITIVETAKNTYPLKKKGKGDAIIHRSLKEKSKLQRLKKFLIRTK